MVAGRKRVSRLVRPQHTRRCPSPVLPLREGTRSLHAKPSLRGNNSDVVENGLLKPTGDVGQHSKNNLRVYECQSWVNAKVWNLLLFSQNDYIKIFFWNAKSTRFNFFKLTTDDIKHDLNPFFNYIIFHVYINRLFM